MSSIPNAINNSVLCFLTTARHSNTDENLIRTCEAFYKYETVFSAKEILYNLTDERCVKRKGDHRLKADLTDMVELLRKLDEGGTVLPSFLCDGYGKMPPAAGFEILAEHIVELVSEMASLRSEMELLKERDSNHVNAHIIDIKEDLRDVKIKLSGVRNINSSQTNQISNGTARRESVTEPMSTYARAARLGNNSSQGSRSQSNVSTSETSMPTGNTSASHTSLVLPVGAASSQAPRVRESTEANANDGEWTTVQPRRRNRRFITGSKTPSAGTFRGVEQLSNFNIGRCAPATSTDALIEYVKTSIGIEPVTCECISNENARAKSFKLTINSSDSDSVLDEESWPENVYVRRFYKPRVRRE